MGIFVSGRVAITAAGVTDEKDITPQTDVIYVRRKMDYGTRQRVVGAAAKVIEQEGQTKRGKRDKKAKRKTETEVNVGAYQMALLQENILEWRGPQFAGIALVRRNIEQLDPDDPIMKAVLKYISEANTADTDDDDEDDEAGDAIGAEEDDDDPNVIEGEIVGLIRTSPAS
jgi:hypothetical protein